MGKRIEYIDAIKGFSILWVFLFHFSSVGYFASWKWIYVPYRIPLFFLYSGIFFRMKPFGEFVIKKINTLIVPFLVFWAVGFVMGAIKFEVFIHGVFGINVDDYNVWEHLTSLKGLFYLRPEMNPCGENVPVWFLLVLFMMQLLHYGLNRLTARKWVIILVALILYPAGQLLFANNIKGLFFIYMVFVYYIHYVLGVCYAPALVKLIIGRRIQLVLVAVCLPVLAVLSLTPPDLTGAVIYQFFMEVRVVCFCILIFIFFKNTSGFVLFRVFRFFGRNSLAFLVTHGLAISMWADMRNNLLPARFAAGNSLLFDLFVLVALLVIEYFVIRFLNRFTPVIIGKKELLTNRQGC